MRGQLMSILWPAHSYVWPAHVHPMASQAILEPWPLFVSCLEHRRPSQALDVQRARALLHKIRYDHDPPTTFAELAKVGPPNCTYIEINGRPGGENHKGSIDFWRREKPAFGIVAAKYKNANKKN